MPQTPGAEAPIHPDGRYAAAEVARLVFRRSPDWFYRNRARLAKEEGFPGPITRIGRPHWTGRSLLDWLHRAAPAGRRTPDTDDPADTGIDRELDRRLQVIRGGKP